MPLVLCHAVFWLALFLVVYPYTIYPLLLRALGWLRPRGWLRQPNTPKMSVIIAAHNEEGVIASKVENTLALDYPAEQLEIMVASDGSTDRTNQIAAGYAPRVRLLEIADRGGKQVALNRAVEQATGEILVFTDASVMLAQGSAKAIARNFADPAVGAVSSVIKIRKPSMDGAPAGKQEEAEGAYLDLDLTTRRLESRLGSAVGCCGSCYAVRRQCFRPFAPWECNDFASALDAVRNGFRVVMDEEAVGFMLPARTGGVEFRRKARTITGGIDTLWQSGAWKTGFGNPVFWWQLWSHKIARWLGPPALLVAAIPAAIGAMLGDSVFVVLTLLGVFGLAVGLLAILLPRLGQRVRIFRLASFALIAWAAAIWAWIEFFRGRKQVLWTPTMR